jgi:hypothetical protein
MKKIVVVCFVIFALSGCYYDNLEELHPGDPPCDTTGVISFSTDIDPIFKRSCGSQDLACHNTDQSSSTYGLGTYDDVIFTIDDSGDFLETITHDPSISASLWMPKDGNKLDACSIQKIQAWLNRGRLNN